MFVLDTNTISDYFRGDATVVTRLQSLAPSQVGIPTVVLYELRYGLSRLPQGVASQRLHGLEQLILPIKLLPFGDAAAQAAATISVALERAGEGAGLHDIQIAATTIVNGGTLVTRNTKSFTRIPGLAIVNWQDDISIDMRAD
ncbi:MAG: PIN domain-containing protein [Burkholderiaceae bacterium]